MQYLIQAGISLGVALITLVGGYCIYGPKLRKEQKSEFQKDIGKKKAEALMEFKEIIAKCDSIEVYASDEQLSNNVILKLREINGGIYPAIMNNKDSLIEIMDKISALRKKEMYLDQEAGAYLLYIYKYLYELSNFIGVMCQDIAYPILGGVFIYDVQKWTAAADQVVIRDINDAKVTLESHKNNQWKKVKERVYSSLYDDSLLCLLQMEPESMNAVQREKYEIIEEFFESNRLTVEA